ncbi:hypothetical protein EV424DRAFT_1343637 [Suillus variegatus]|nr:hypothetical protein EV424DRAFT_1343637 [Suillus variegatus]
MPNQHKPTPPLDELAPHILRYWKTQLNDKEIVQALQKHFNTEHYGIRLTKFHQIRVDMGLEWSRRQGYTIETIHEAVTELRKMYPHAGTREMISLLFHEKSMSVSRLVMMSYFTAYEPELHDKWLRFGLSLHTGIEPFSGCIMWIRVWHSNRNPQLILNYYLDTIAELGWTKNYGIANAQTLLCQRYDPTLQGTLQHHWMCTKKNVVETDISVALQRLFTPGFENLLDEGVIEGWYDSADTLQMMIFRWVFIPWLQQELDAYRDRVNNSTKRRDHNKVLPHGVPTLIYHSPEDFGALDFKAFICTNREGINYIHNVYIDASNPVFDLVPPMLGDFIKHCYDAMGRPAVTRSSVWTVYRNVLSAVQLAENPHPNLLLTENEGAVEVSRP